MMLVAVGDQSAGQPAEMSVTHGNKLVSYCGGASKTTAAKPTKSHHLPYLVWDLQNVTPPKPKHRGRG
jgi:hypothetical protein